jgi:uncharacterized Fe-S cluster-containing protein
MTINEVPKFYVDAKCIECGNGDCDLMVNRITDRLICVDCLNKMLNSFEENKDKKEKWYE